MAAFPAGPWDYFTTFESSKDQLEFYDTLPGEYKEPGLLDHRPPKRIIGISGKDIPRPSKEAIDGLVSQRNYYINQLPLQDGSTVSGFLLKATSDPVEYAHELGDTLYNMKLAVRLDGTLNITWRYWGDFTSQKDLIEFYGGLPGLGNIIPYTVITSKAPKKTVGLSATGVKLADVLVAWTLLDTPDTIITLQTGDGAIISGIPFNFHARHIQQTGLYDVLISLWKNATTIPQWQYYGEGTSEKQLTEYYPAAKDLNTYAAPIFYDQRPPRETKNIFAVGVTQAEVQKWYNANRQKGVPVSIPMADGTVVKGALVHVREKQYEYTLLYTIGLVVRIA